MVEELNLEHNMINKIQGLENLTKLKKLELGMNKIAFVENLS